MTEYWTIERVLEVVAGDRDFVETFFAHELCERRPEGLLPEEVDEARIAHVLVRDLEVNWAGVEIILRLRRELVETQRQIADLFELVRAARSR